MSQEQKIPSFTSKMDIGKKEMKSQQSKLSKNPFNIQNITDVFQKIQTETQLFLRNLRLFNKVSKNVLHEKSRGQKASKITQIYLQMQKDSIIYAQFIDNFRDKYGVDIEDETKEFSNARLIQKQLQISTQNQQIFYEECILLLSVAANNFKGLCQLTKLSAGESKNDGPKDFKWSEIMKTFSRLKNTILILSALFFSLEDKLFSRERSTSMNSITYTLYQTSQIFDDIQKKYYKIADLAKLQPNKPSSGLDEYFQMTANKHRSSEQIIAGIKDGTKKIITPSSEKNHFYSPKNQDVYQHKVAQQRQKKSQDKEDERKPKEGNVKSFFKRNLPAFYQMLYSPQEYQEDQDEKQPFQEKRQ